MNYRERFFAAMDQKPVDRVPVGFWHHFSGMRGIGQNAIDNHIEFYKKNDLDFLKMMCDSYFEYPFSCRIDTASDWARIRPLGKNSEYIRGQVERAKAINGVFQADKVCLYNVFVPFSVIRHSTSNDMVMAHLRENPKAIRHAMKVVAEDTVDLITALMEEAGCDALYIPLQGGEVNRFTREEYEELVQPYDKLIFDVANFYSDYNIAHLCAWAGTPNQLELWQNVPVKCVNWAVSIENMSLTEGRKFFGGKTCLGGFDNRPGGILMTGNEEQIKSYTKELIRSYGTTGLILGADCTISEDIDEDHLRWVIEATKEY